MDMALTADDRDVRERARAFARGFLHPHEEELDENNGLPDATEAAIRQGVLDHGLNAINHAREVGGQQMTVVQQCLVNEEVGNATNALWSRVWQPPICLRDGTPEQIETYLAPACRGEISVSFCTSEPAAGSDAGGVKTSARLDGNRYVIDGEKCFASYAEYADVNLLTTVVDGDPAKPTLFLVDKGTEGFNVRRLPRFAQRSGHGHPELDIVDMRVPATQMLARSGRASSSPRTGSSRRAWGSPRAASAWPCARASWRWGGRGSASSSAGPSSASRPSSSCWPRWRPTSWPGSPCCTARPRRSIPASTARPRTPRRAPPVFLFGGRVPGGGQGRPDLRGTRRHVREPGRAPDPGRAPGAHLEGTSEIQKVVIGGQIKKRGLDMYTGWD